MNLIETFLTYSALVSFPCLNLSIDVSIELQIFGWFFVFFLIFLLRSFIYVSAFIYLNIFMQLKKLGQVAVNSDSTLRKLNFVTSFENFTKAVHSRFVHFHKIMPSDKFLWNPNLYFSITENCLPILLFINSMTRKNNLKEIERDKRLEKQKQRSIKINTTHFTCQSNKNWQQIIFR